MRISVNDDSWAFTRLSLQCGCDIVLAEDPNGFRGRTMTAAGAELYWLGYVPSNPLVGTNMTFPYDATMCSTAPTVTPPAPNECNLVTSTSNARRADSRYDPKFIEFLSPDGTWTAPQPVLGGWVRFGMEYTDTVVTPTDAQAVRLSVSSTGDDLSFWKLELDCGACATVLIQDPNGAAGRVQGDDGWADYWLMPRPFQGAGAQSQQYSVSLSSCAPTQAPTAPPPSAAPTLSIAFWFKVWTADTGVRDRASNTFGQPMVAFMVDGVWTDNTRLSVGARVGSTIQQYVTLANWPTQVVLSLDHSDSWQFWRVAMYMENRDCEVVLLENPSGQTGSELDGDTEGVYWLGRRLSAVQTTYLTPYNPDTGETMECVANHNGAAYDGYLTTCRVEVDHESGAAIHTNDDGSYSLNIPADILETVELIITPDLSDCSDVGSGEALAIVLRGPPGCTALTPLTTLLAAVMRAANATVADADAMTKSALSLPAGEPLMHHDAIASATNVNATHEDAADALQSMVALTKVHSFLLQVRGGGCVESGEKGFGHGARKIMGPLNEAQRPRVRGVRVVALGAGYNRGEGNRRASRNGLRELIAALASLRIQRTRHRRVCCWRGSG